MYRLTQMLGEDHRLVGGVHDLFAIASACFEDTFDLEHVLHDVHWVVQTLWLTELPSQQR